MKRIFTLITILTAVVIANAGPVNVKLAKKVAVNFLSAQKSEIVDTFDLELTYTHKYEKEDAFYIFSSPNGGFVIVSADDEAVPIIGYSLTNRAVKKITNTTLLNQFDTYGKQVRFAAKNKTASKEIKEKWDALINAKGLKQIKAAGPLLTTIWNQDPRYNKFCPAGTPTGCVATAMSQIMRYHEWPTSGRGWYKYTHATFGTQYANFGETTYDFSNMPNSLSESSSLDQIDAVATLCYHAGVSVNMNYSSSGSGAFSRDVLFALTSYFYYDPTTINIYDFDPNSETEWINKVKTEIDAGRPIYYSGSSSADGGHAWVCDGYDNGNKLHMNWGWGGSYNGFYVVTAMTPGSTNFSDNNSMITGIKPLTSGFRKLWAMQASGFIHSSRGVHSISAIDKQVAWAVGYDGSGNNTPVKDFTLTTDGGATWNSGTINAPNTDNMSVAMISAIDKTTAWAILYISSNSSSSGCVVKTTDGGKTWVKQESASFAEPSGFPNVIHFWDVNNGFCMGDPNGGSFEIYTTTNGGDTWNRVDASNIPTPQSGEMGNVGSMDVYGNIVWFATNKGRIYKSTDKGASWQVFSTPLDASFNIAFKNESTGVIVGKKSGVITYCRTTDGGENWTVLTPTGRAYYNDITYIPGTDTLIASGSDYSNKMMGIGYSVDDGTTFTDYAPFYQNFQFLALGATADGTVWAGGYNTDSYNRGMWKHGESGVSGNFMVNRSVAFKNDSTVIFSDLSYGNPDTWEWDFGADASPKTLTGQGPHTVKYTSYGNKTITLTVHKGSDIHVVIKENYVYVTWPSGIDDKEQKTDFIPYPNPASSGVYVKLKGFTKGSINLYSITGALVWSSNGTTTDNRIAIDNLPSGIYLIRIKSIDGKVTTKKLTISR